VGSPTGISGGGGKSHQETRWGRRRVIGGDLTIQKSKKKRPTTINKNGGEEGTGRHGKKNQKNGIVHQGGQRRQGGS